jgi:hypothetical protein
MSDTNTPVAAPEKDPELPLEHMVYIQFWLPAEMKDKVRRIAAQRGITMSEAIRRALNPYLSKVK